MQVLQFLLLLHNQRRISQMSFRDRIHFKDMCVEVGRPILGSMITYGHVHADGMSDEPDVVHLHLELGPAEFGAHTEDVGEDFARNTNQVHLVQPVWRLLDLRLVVDRLAAAADARVDRGRSVGVVRGGSKDVRVAVRV